jgi:hypothetical protein
VSFPGLGLCPSTLDRDPHQRAANHPAMETEPAASRVRPPASGPVEAPSIGTLMGGLPKGSRFHFPGQRGGLPTLAGTSK